MRSVLSAPFAVMWLALMVDGVWGQAAVSAPVARSEVLAQLGSETITQSDIDFILGRNAASADAASSPDTAVAAEQVPLAPALHAQAIELIAQQRRALRTLRDTGQAATAEEIDAGIIARAPAEQLQWTLEQITASVCQSYHLDPHKYRNVIDFRISWPRYLGRHLSEENLRKHFEQQRPRFDGTRFKVDVITIPTWPGQSPDRTRAEHELSKLRQRLQNDPDHWNHLSASVDDSNRLQVLRDTWIRGWGDALPALVTPLLTLAAGELSPPTHTASGVHLIRYVDQQAGPLELVDVRAEVRAHMLIFLLDFLARPHTDSCPLKTLR